MRADGCNPGDKMPRSVVFGGAINPHTLGVGCREKEPLGLDWNELTPEERMLEAPLPRRVKLVRRLPVREVSGEAELLPPVCVYVCVNACVYMTSR
jgi:hypothetical protein